MRLTQNLTLRKLAGGPLQLSCGVFGTGPDGAANDSVIRSRFGGPS